jgi:DNA-binding SARP family transcriptional activator/NTP pyrophosphatase (non-canonical NTP hydrolase)
MTLEIALLGPPRAELDGQRVTFDTRKAMALLAHLALADRPRSRDALCDLLWPAHESDRARGALRRTLSTLRGAIGEEWIDTAGDSIALKRGLTLDVERFRALAADGAPLESLTEAVALHSSAFMEGFSLRDSPDFDDWQTAEAADLERELGSALRRLVELLTARGEFERAIPHARRWLEIDPLHEPAHRELIKLYAWSGDRAAALEQYRRCVRTLSQELGVSPLEDTASLYEQVNDGTLAPPRTASTVSAAARSDRAEGAPPDLPLVGRDEELASLANAHADARSAGMLAVIEGEPGIGKSRLGSELAQAVGSRGAIVLAARCHDDEAGLPYGPVVELLRGAIGRGASGWADDVPARRLADAALLLPELGELQQALPHEAELEGPGAKVRLLEAVAAVIEAACRGPEPGVVLLDDVHAADEATVDVISYLGRRLIARQLLLVIAWRSEAVPPGHRLRRLVSDLLVEGRAVIVEPARLDRDQVSMLVRSAGRSEATADLAGRIYVESEGLPLFVAEYLAALRGGGPAEETPVEVRSVLEARLGRLHELARQVLGGAAVIGRSFDLDMVRHASGRSDEETVSALEELVAEGVVREVVGSPGPTYDFSHQKLRAQVYEQTSLARRRLLHQRVADALSRRPPGEEDEALIAQHLRLAGNQAGAAGYYRLAGERAASLHAPVDALEHFESALALAGRDAGPLHERIGDLRTLVGDYSAALASYETAAAELEQGARAAIEHKAGGVHLRRGEWERARTRFTAALAAAPEAERGLRARIQADCALALHHDGEGQHAVELAGEALALAESAGDQRAQAQAQNMLGVLAREAGEHRPAVAALERSLALAEELGDESAQVAALNNLALVRRDAGDLSEALVLTEKALRLCAHYGDRHREAALENNLADLHHAAGDESAAMTHLKRAVTIFAEIGGDEATRLPEIWKLVSW